MYTLLHPSVLVRFRGQAPLGTKVFRLGQLRCNLCLTVFTAKPPEEAGTEKYDATAASMIALLRYGTGVPWNRLEGLEAGFGIPLPTSTLWDVSEAAYKNIAIAFEELKNEAAQGDVFYNDDTPGPRLLLLVNGHGHEPKVVAGWPVILQIKMVLQDSKPWRVSGGAAPWSRFVRLEMPGDAPWGFEAALSAPNEVTVDERTAARLYFTLAPEASAKLVRGERTLRAVLESKDPAGGGWTGVAATREVRVSVVDEPRPLPPQWAERKAEVEIDYAFCRQGAASALALAETAARAQPESWRLLTVKGQLLAGRNRCAEALAALERSLALWWRQNPNGWEPPPELVQRRDALADGAVDPEAGK